MAPVIAILGGTGAEGFGLASRFAHAGAHIIIGSRDLQKAQSAAARIPGAEGRLNPDAAASAKIVILTVPLAAQIATLKSVRDRLQPGTILIDATVPLEASIGGRISRTVTLWSGSAAQQAAQHVPDAVHVASAFHTLSAELLAELDRPIDGDVLYCADHPDAKTAVRELIAMVPDARAVDAGPLENARCLENLAALLISLNIRHKVKGSGIKITGLP